MHHAYQNQVTAGSQSKVSHAPPATCQDQHPGLVAITAQNLVGRSSRLESVVDRVQALADRIYGQSIAESAAQTNGPVPSLKQWPNDADQLFFALERLDRAIERLEAELPRVEQL